MRRDMFKYRSMRGAMKDSWVGSTPYYRYALYLITLTAFLNVLWVVYNVGYSDGASTANQHSISGVDGIRSLNVRIGIGLLVAMIALWLRGIVSFVVSAVALGYIGGEYAVWYLDSVNALKIMGMESWADFQDPDFPYVGALRGATWWNIVVLAAVSILLIWQLMVLIRPRQSLNKN
jgi:hypothetical protein